MHKRSPSSNSNSPLPSMNAIKGKLASWGFSSGILSAEESNQLNNGEGAASSSANNNNNTITEQSMSEEWDEMSQLTMSQRLTGFFMSLAMGIIFIVIAMSFVPLLAVFAKKFAFFYSCGSLFCVGSTSFLVGPQKQFKMMFESNRAQAAAGYVGSLFMTLVSAIYWRSATLSFVFAGMQIISVLWYSLSYIPFARQVVGSFISYAWVILKPVLSVLGSLVGSCIGYVCGGSGGQ